MLMFAQIRHVFFSLATFPSFFHLFIHLFICQFCYLWLFGVMFVVFAFGKVWCGFRSLFIVSRISIVSQRRCAQYLCVDSLTSF